MKKAQWALLAVTAGFICVLLGIYIGRNTAGSFLQFPEVSQSPQVDTTEPSATTERGKLDINKATAQELMMLPGIGEVIAQRIVAYRETNGPFQALEDLLNVEDIGPTRLERIYDYITIGE